MKNLFYVFKQFHTVYFLQITFEKISNFSTIGKCYEFSFMFLTEKKTVDLKSTEDRRLVLYLDSK